MDLKLKDETYQKFLQAGIPFTARIPTKPQPRYVKVIVYNYEADLVGSVTKDIW